MDVMKLVGPGSNETTDIRTEQVNEPRQGVLPTISVTTYCSSQSHLVADSHSNKGSSGC